MSRHDVQVHDLVGTPGEVRSVLENACAQQRLVSFTAPEPVVRVQVELLAARRARRRWDLSVRNNQDVYLYLAVFVLSVAIAGVLAYALMMAALAVVAWLSSHLATVVATVVVALGLLLLVGRSGASCSGLHCGGCRG
jgi:polyferredoxin